MKRFDPGIEDIQRRRTKAWRLREAVDQTAVARGRIAEGLAGLRLGRRERTVDSERDGGGERLGGFFRGIRIVIEGKVADKLARIDQGGYYQNIDGTRQATIKVGSLVREIDVHETPSPGIETHITISVSWDETYGSAMLPYIAARQETYEHEELAGIATYSSIAVGSSQKNTLGLGALHRAAGIALSLQVANAPQQFTS